jgi:GTP-dependent phosphoenolpyruvate carboxykinase
VASVAKATLPDRIHWCDGSPAETARLREELIARGELQPLNTQTTRTAISPALTRATWRAWNT